MIPAKAEYPTTIVRPYNTRIRDRVVSLLERVGCSFDEKHLVLAGTGDTEAIEQVVSMKNRLLLLPFHAHRDPQGQPIDGISFFEQLVADRERGWQALMPTTDFGRAALGLRINALPQMLREKVHVFSTNDIGPDRKQSSLTPLRAFLARPN